VYPLNPGREITAAQAAMALVPLAAGRGAFILFAIGLLNAALFAASILPLSTAYTVCEGIGWERGLDQPFSKAPQFYGLYTLMIVGGAGAVLLPGAQLIRIMILSQVLNGLLLPVILVVMVRLVTRPDIMGKLVAGRTYAAICWVITALLIGLDLFLLGAKVVG
jgi:Mn2+/Fe2+ NRAMP family transporter